MTEMIIELVALLLKIVAVACLGMLTKHVLPWMREVAIPWLKERHLYNLICYFVRAAEKLADTGAIDKTTKKEYVIKLLKQRGINITSEVDALIESAVLDLDMAVASVFDAIKDAFDDDSPDVFEDEIAE